jgi:hypothetical protein
MHCNSTKIYAQDNGTDHNGLIQEWLIDLWFNYVLTSISCDLSTL